MCGSPVSRTFEAAVDVYQDDFSTSDSIYTCRNCGTGYSYPFYTAGQLNKIYKNYSGYTHDDKRSSSPIYKLWVFMERLVMKICLGSAPIALKKAITSSLFAYLFQTYPIYSVQSPKKLNILDVGCGGGHFLRIARDTGADVYGTEIDKKLVSRLRAHGIKAYLNIDEIAKRHIKFDIIRLNHVVEHLVDPNIELAKVHKLLQKNGELIIGLPNYNTLARMCGSSMFLHLPFHRTHNTRIGLRRLLANNGFRIVYLRTKSTGVFSRSLLRMFRLNSSVYTIPLKLVETGIISPVLDLFGIGDSIELYAKRKSYYARASHN